MATGKSNSNIDWFRIANVDGDRSDPQPSGPADFSVDPLSDNHGRAIVRIHDGTGYVAGYSGDISTLIYSNSSTYLPAPGGTVAVGNRMYQAWGHNSSPTLDGFVMFFDSLASSAGIPEIIIPVNRLESFSISIAPPGWSFILGLRVAFSSTDLVFTPFAVPLLYVNTVSG